MGGHQLLDTTQIINGIAVMLSFFVGYKYALKGSKEKDKEFSEKNITTPLVDRIFSSYSDNYKMVLLVRNDLKMGKGKIAAQCGHGAVGAYQKAIKRTPSLVRAWEHNGCAKVALRVDSEAELLALKRAAERQKLNTCLIIDAGRTQIEPNSKTVVAIGPAAVNDIDRITGHLKLL